MDSTESYPVAEYEIKVDSRVILYENQGGVFLYQNFMHILPLLRWLHHKKFYNNWPFSWTNSENRSKLTINWMWCRQIDFELRDFVGIGSVPQFCLPFELAEKLRKHAFENRTTKTSTMVEALEKYLKK